MNRNFDDYLNESIKEDYLSYCVSINKNIIKAYYDVYILINLKPYTSRHSVFEKCSKNMLEHFVNIIWIDLILCVTRILEHGGIDRLILKSFSSLVYKNMKQNIEFKDFNIDQRLYNEIQNIRDIFVAHDLNILMEYKINVDDMLILLEQAREIFNDRQFTIDNNDYTITDKTIDDIASDSEKGVKELFKESLSQSGKLVEEI